MKLHTKDLFGYAPGPVTGAPASFRVDDMVRFCRIVGANPDCVLQKHQDALLQQVEECRLDVGGRLKHWQSEVVRRALIG